MLPGVTRYSGYCEPLRTRARNNGILVAVADKIMEGLWKLKFDAAWFELIYEARPGAFSANCEPTTAFNPK